jgi:hypothetical protein
MNWGVTGLLILFGAFVLLLIINPNLSCFGKRLKSPFYPLYRKKKSAEEEKARRAKQIKTTDYGFKLGEDKAPPPRQPSAEAKKKAEDYGFKLDP